MQIRHFCNSFISYKSKNFNLVCDPWVGKIKENAWHSFPTYKNGIGILKKINPDYIYISHLHTDHLDRNLLSKWFKLKPKCKIIIKKFKDGRLKKSIELIGFRNILELEEWKIYEIKEHKIIIIPQMTSNKDNLESSIEYDLDSSILIYSKKKKKIFFNNSDNPLSVNDIKKINKFVKKKFKKYIHIACLPVGAASEYPQCFLNINREKEKQKVIQKCIDSTRDKLKVIKPDIFFQAGGTYILSGKFSELGKFIAQPSDTTNLKKILPKNSTFAELEGNGTLTFQNDEWKVKNNTIDLKKLKNKLEQKFKVTKYDYHKLKIKKKKISQIFNDAKNNYFEKLSRLNLKNSWKIDFHVYENIELKKLQIDQKRSKLFNKFKIEVKNSNLKNKSKLIIFVDLKLFYLLLTRKYPWNISLSGSYILYKRYPNKFDPNVTFSLNFLAV